jgi:hypothetical protein
MVQAISTKSTQFLNVLFRLRAWVMQSLQISSISLKVLFRFRASSCKFQEKSGGGFWKCKVTCFNTLPAISSLANLTLKAIDNERKTEVKNKTCVRVVCLQTGGERGFTAKPVKWGLQFHSSSIQLIQFNSINLLESSYAYEKRR